MVDRELVERYAQRRMRGTVKVGDEISVCVLGKLGGFHVTVTAFGKSDSRNLGDTYPSAKDILEVIEFLVPRIVVPDVMES